MRAWEVLYSLGERTAEVMIELGVEKPFVESWHKGWGKRVLDPCQANGSVADVVIQVVKGLTVARVLVELTNGD